MYTFIKIDPTVYLKWMHLKICKLYFNEVDFLKTWKIGRSLFNESL